MYNGSQFDSQALRDFCAEHSIEQWFASRSYPHANGQAESSNRTILSNIKRRLETKKGNWSDELFKLCGHAEHQLDLLSPPHSLSFME